MSVPMSVPTITKSFTWKSLPAPTITKSFTRQSFPVPTNTKSFTRQSLHGVPVLEKLNFRKTDDEWEWEDLNEAEIFERDYLMNVVQLPFKSSARFWSFRGAGISGILTIAAGPIGCIVGIAVGFAAGLLFGFIHDVIKLTRKQNDAKRQLTKIEHLVRFAEFHFAKSPDPLQIIFKLITEYEGFAVLGSICKAAREATILFCRFIQRQDVQYCLQLYLDYFCYNWRHMTPSEVSMCQASCEVSVACFNHTGTKQPVVVQRMQHLLEDPSVHRLFNQVDCLSRRTLQKAANAVDCLIYADSSVDALKSQKTVIANKKTTQNQPYSIMAELVPIGSMDLPNVCEIEGSVSQETISEDDSKQIPFLDDLQYYKQPIDDIFDGAIQDGQELDTAESELKSVSELTNNTSDIPEGVPPVETCITRVSQLLTNHAARSMYASKEIRTTTIRDALDRASETLKDQGDASVESGSDRGTMDGSYPKKSVIIEVKDPTVTTPSPAPLRVPKLNKPVQEARLFKSFTDLMTFDVEMKNRTPIDLYEFEFLKEKEVLDSTDDRWENAVNQQHLQLYKLHDINSPVVMVKVYTVLPKIPVAVATRHIQHFETRIKWDKTFNDMRLLETDLDGNEVTYCSFTPPWPVANRDFLSWRRVVNSDGVVYIMQRSATHPEMPPRQNYIRADTIISGYILRPLEDDPEGSCSLFILAQTDIKGLVPAFVVNQGAQRSPVQWVNNLKKACYTYIETNNNATNLT